MLGINPEEASAMRCPLVKPARVVTLTTGLTALMLAKAESDEEAHQKAKVAFEVKALQNDLV